MSRIKKKEDVNRVSLNSIKYSCSFQKENDLILFSFKYMTKKENYSLEKFKSSKNLRNDLSIINDFHQKLNSMSMEGWTGLEKRNKDQGGKELLEYSQLMFNAYDPNKELDLTGDSKVMVLRFGGKKYRLIGYRGRKCSFAFYILGFDFDFSAYKH